MTGCVDDHDCQARIRKRCKIKKVSAHLTQRLIVRKNANVFEMIIAFRQDTLLDFDGDIDLDVEGDRAIVSIDGGEDLSKLVGRRGEVLDALQELTRLAVHQKTGERSRLMLDIASWRRRRRDELSALGDKVARRVRESGEREELAPMTPFERKIVHDAVAAVDGVHSESEGVEPARRVVVLKD